MNKNEWTELEQRIAKDYSNIAGIVIAKDGELEYEQYFHQCNKMSKVHVYSVTKSILSILIGIAIDRGHIHSVEQKVLDFFPEHKYKKRDEVLQQITIRHLLTMTAPFRYKFAPLTYIRYFMSSDWLTFTLNQLGGKKSIGIFHYTPIVGPDILSGILTRATGKSVLEFANEHLFHPLHIEIQQKIVFKSAKEQREFNKSTTMSGWVADSKCIHAGGWGLTLSAKDMLKIGQLYLDEGHYEGQQIVSSEWVKQSTTEHSRWDKIDKGFGYLWWLDDEKSFAAMGDSGNIIYVNREKKLIVAIASLQKQNAKDRIELIKEHIEPIV